MIASPIQRALSLLVAATVCAAPLPALAGPANGNVAALAVAAQSLAAETTVEPATDGKTVSLLRFEGGAGATDLRGSLQPALEAQGYTVKGVALDLPAAAKKLKCKGDPTQDECLTTLGKWLNDNPRTASDFIIFGTVADAPASSVTMVVFDIAKGQRVKTFETSFNEGDLILPIVLPQAVTTAIDHHREPPAPATAEEQAVISKLDEPEKTPEELRAEQEEIDDAQKGAGAGLQDAVIDTDSIEVDLKEDFEDFCRNEPRRKRESKDDPRDLRPHCDRGPFWGYWQPRAWVALGLTAGTALAAGGLYGAALAARGPYKDAVDALDAYNAQANGDPRRDPNAAAGGYDALATEVSRTGALMRRRAIVGDVLLGTSVLLGGVLAIIIYQDRKDAKQFIKEEKGLRSISKVRVSPILTRQTQGLGLSLRF